MKSKDIKVKCIYHNAGGINGERDPAFPFMMEVNLQPPDFMIVAFVMMHGGSEVLRIQGMTVEDLMSNSLSDHCRLRRIVITDSGGKVVKHKDGPLEPWMEG